MNKQLIYDSAQEIADGIDNLLGVSLNSQQMAAIREKVEGVITEKFKGTAKMRETLELIDHWTGNTANFPYKELREALNINQ